MKIERFFRIWGLVVLLMGFGVWCRGEASITSAVDCICFSYDRPMQLEAFLTSVQKRVHGLNQLFVLYRTSDNRFEKAYAQVIRSFPAVTFVKQDQPEQPSFKRQLLKLMFEQSQSSYVMFGVDDIIMTDEVALPACVEALKKTGAFGFYLRLGKNITRCYTLAIEYDFALPPLTPVLDGMYAWQFDTGLYDWNYPTSFDMTVYAKEALRNAFVSIEYWSPNSLDTFWHARAGVGSGTGLCFEHSKMVNIPLNLVQENKLDRNMNAFSTEELLEEFMSGVRINVDSLYKHDNKSPHEHFIPPFTQAKAPVVKSYFCTAADEQYFPWLINLIGSIHKTNFDTLEDIAVYDLGFTEQQRQALRSMQKVHVYPIELTNPDLLKHFKTNETGKVVRGWYAWKPVAIKQALERFPYVLYLDAGCTVLKPLNDLFAYIQEHNYFLLQDQVWYVGGQNKQFVIGEQCTDFVRNKFNLNNPDRQWILQMPSMYAAVQGMSRAMLSSYVMPMYELTKDLRNFQDDGSSMYGFGWARHDQVLYSIKARLLGLSLVEPHKDVVLVAGDKPFTIHAGDSGSVQPHIFYNCKGQLDFADSIRWR